MLSAPDQAKLAMVGLLAAATLVAGCTRTDRTQRPFSDVTDPQRNESTPAVAEADAPAVSDVAVSDTAAPTEAAAQSPPQPSLEATAQTTEPGMDDEPARRPPAVVPPTEPIRAETPTAAGPATTAAANGDATRFQIVADAPAIVPTTQPVNGTQALGGGAEIPIEIDEVGLVRQWPLWIGERPSGNIVAGPTYWTELEREPQRTELAQAFVEPVEFLWNTLLIPYRIVRTPPWTKVTYDPATEQDSPNAPYEADFAAQDASLPPREQDQGQRPEPRQQQ